MATRIYDEEDIILQDGTEVTLRPLPIARLRRFMAAWEKFPEAEDEMEGLGILLNCAGIGLENNFPDKFERLTANAEEKGKGQVLSTEYAEYLEAVLDIDSIYKVLEVTGGIKLNDPKLMEAAMELTRQNESDGTN